MAEEYLTMHGVAFDNSGEIVETQVHINNKQAFLNAGWVEGKLLVKTQKVVEEAKTEEVEEVEEVEVNELGEKVVSTPKVSETKTATKSKK